MKASEIRSRYMWDCLEPKHAHLIHVQAAGEIAAQLAEMNERGTPVWVEFAWKGREVWLDVSRVVEVYKSETGDTYIHRLGEDPEHDRAVDGGVGMVMTRIGVARG